MTVSRELELDPESGEMYFEDWVKLQEKGAAKPAPKTCGGNCQHSLRFCLDECEFQSEKSGVDDAPCGRHNFTFCHVECDEYCDDAYREYLIRHFASNPDPWEPMSYDEHAEMMAKALR